MARISDMASKSVRPQRGEQLELRIEGVAHGGAGVARRDGYVVFVEAGLPGDIVRAELTKVKRDYANARAVALIESGADRVPERCDHDGGGCPGAAWQAMRYTRQLQAKQDLVADAMRRIAKLDRFEVEPIVAATDTWRYRNKLEYSFGVRGDGSLALGFHARGRWEVIKDVHDCMLGSERNSSVRNLVRAWCEQEGLSAYDRRAGHGFLRNLIVREGRRTGALQVRLVTTPGDFRGDGLASALRDRFPNAALLWTRTSELAELSSGGRTDVLLGGEWLEEELGGLRFQISSQAFFQTNTEMAERLYAIASDYAGLSGRERVYDLYCGIGTLSLALSREAGEVWAVDIVKQAVADAIANARANEVKNARFFAGDVRDALRPLAERAPRPDVVLVDPPRAGLSKKVVRRLIEIGAPRIVYVSCNPTTLAPNARQLVDAGYGLVKVRAVDMFPHTPHIECVALLERGGDR